MLAFPQGNQTVLPRVICRQRLNALGRFDFPVPPDGHVLTIHAQFRSAQAVTADTFHLYFNGDHAAVAYAGQYLSGGAVSTTGGNVPADEISLVTGATSTAGYDSAVRIVIPNYNSYRNYKFAYLLVGFMQDTNPFISQVGFYWNSFEPIRRVELYPSNSPQAFIAGSVAFAWLL